MKPSKKHFVKGGGEKAISHCDFGGRFSRKERRNTGRDTIDRTNCRGQKRKTSKRSEKKKKKKGERRSGTEAEESFCSLLLFGPDSSSSDRNVASSFSSSS